MRAFERTLEQFGSDMEYVSEFKISVIAAGAAWDSGVVTYPQQDAQTDFEGETKRGANTIVLFDDGSSLGVVGKNSQI